MSAVDLLHELRTRGIEVITRGEHLVLRPRGRLSPALIEQVRQQKPEIMLVLAREQRDRWLLALIERLDLEPLTWRDALRLERESAIACERCGAYRRVLGLEVCGDCWARAKERGTRQLRSEKLRGRR